MKKDAKFVKHVNCEECGSSDGNALYDDGSAFCFVCKTYSKDDSMQQSVQPSNANLKVYSTNMTENKNYRDIPDRKLTADTCKAYEISVVQDVSGNIIKHVYPYYNTDGSHVANKFRVVANKTFPTEGNITDTALFGQKNFPAKGKYITITEGELDAAATYQMFGSQWPCVSVRSSTTAVSDCQKNMDYLNSFDNVILCFDNDKAGREAANKVAALFEPNTCSIVKLSKFKDASDYLKAGCREDFTKAWWGAEPYTPAGIINLGKLGDSLYEEDFCESVAYPWPSLNEKTFGCRTGELVTWTSGSGMGKSSVLRELMHHFLYNTKDNIGILALEENTKKTAFNIMAVEANQRLYIKEVRDQFTKEQLKRWEEKTIGTGRLFAFDHFGSISNDEILSRIRYMAKALDCKWVFLDHLSILVSGQEEGDERRGIDVLMTKLRSLVEETGISLNLVSHLRRANSSKSHEEGGEVSLAHLRGSHSIAQLSDMVYALERNQQETDETLANTTLVRILKNRYSGEVGPTTYLFYDKDSGRMSEISNPFEVKEDEEGEAF